MAAPAARNVLKVPGKVVKDPTNLSAAYPYGGTELGITHNLIFKPQTKHYPLTAEEWGEQVYEVLHLGHGVIFAATLRGLDNDALSSIFTDTTTGDPSGDTNVSFRVDTARAGSILSGSAMKVIFVPEAPLRHRAILIRNAIGVVAEDAQWALTAADEMVTNVVWYGTPDANGDVGEMAYIKDLSL